MKKEKNLEKELKITRDNLKSSEVILESIKGGLLVGGVTGGIAYFTGQDSELVKSMMDVVPEYIGHGAILGYIIGNARNYFLSKR
ncbi:MAG: hypothetical protein U9Q99_02760 [Nanoarchaeota archaeon]|nr:hypothetical protein [Nanoarchaeota archaeon]